MKLKILCECGCGNPTNFTRGKQSRFLAGHHAVGKSRPGLEASESPTPIDIAWAAGIYEGEGTSQSKPGPAGGTVRASVSQKDTWVLERLVALFGGSISTTNPGMSGWFISGPRARGFLTTMYVFLSPRRKAQIQAVLS